MSITFIYFLNGAIEMLLTAQDSSTFHDDTVLKNLKF